MEKEEFIKKISEQATNINIKLNSLQINQLYTYMQLLIEWNKNINLTAITEPKEIIQKHFIDSLTINKYIKDKDKMIDVGTGAGFPGIPIKIINNMVDVTLLDSLNKRLIYLNEVIKELDLKQIETIHYRAEEAGNDEKYREKFDIAVSRAVAPLNILVEYILPLVKIDGICICMKGNSIEEEINNSKNAIQELGGKIENIDEFNLPNSDIQRNLIIIRKIKETPIKYPRKAGTPAKEPII